MKNAKRLWLTLLTCAIVMTMSTLAAAFHPINAFTRASFKGGADRVYFTGSPRFNGYDCGTCHVDAPKTLRFQLSATPEDIFTTGQYTPGQTYNIQIGLTGAEEKGLRTWVMEADDESHTPVGNFADVPMGCDSKNGPRSCLQPGCNAICKNNPEIKGTCAPGGQSICSELVKIGGCEACNPNSGCNGCITIDGVVAGSVVIPPWQLRYTAPAAGTGPVTLYFGGVAGTSDHASTGDDYYMASFRLCEGNEACEPSPTSAAEPVGEYDPQATSGCQLTAIGNMTSGEQGWSWWLLCSLAGLVLIRRRKVIV